MLSPARKAGYVPTVPYVANRDTPLTAYVFNAGDVSEDDVDRLIGKFLASIEPEVSKFARPMEIWRGEIRNAGGHFRCLAISKPGRQAVYKKLLEVMGGHSCDYGSRTAIDLALKPQLLVGAEKTWEFDANRPAGSRRRLKLGQTSLEVHALPYVWKQNSRPRAGAKGTLAQRYADLVGELSSWKGRLTNSAFGNWPFLKNAYHALLDANRGQFDYDLLGLVCERAMCLQIVELAMPELGRIVVTPLWERTQQGLGSAECALRIAVDRRAEKRVKFAALAHELGHYLFHLPHHVFFARLPFAVMQNSAVEAAVATKLHAIRAEYYRITEVQADFFAASLVVPEGFGEWYNRSFFTGRETEAAAVETNALHSALRDPAGALSETDLEHLLQQSQTDLRARREIDYDPRRSLLERIGWCIAHREDARVLARHGETDGLIGQTLGSLTSIVSDPASAPAGEGNGAKLYRRIALEDAESFARSETSWDPVIIEPRKHPGAVGYLGLKLAFAPEPGTTHATDWVRHPSDGRERGRYGFVSEWLEEAEASGRGLVLFPIDAAERSLRAAITGAGSMEKMIKRLQDHARNT